MHTAQVAVSREFLDSLSRLPGTQAKKTRELVTRFQLNPDSPGFNFEKIQGAVDPKVRSIRLDKAYRIILVAPPRGDVFLFVRVDHHDDAYAWAQKRRFEVNSVSGVIQIYDTESGADIDPGATGGPQDGGGAAVSCAPEPSGLFSRHDDEVLLMAGVPQTLLPAVRAVYSEPELDDLAPHIPPDAAEMLYLLAAGYDLLEAIEESGRSGSATPVSEDDFLTALANPASRSAFKLISDDRELNAILDAPLAQWRVFLHPSQRRLVEMQARGPVRVLGGAGTGKTVALIHRAAWLAKNVFTGRDDRILVTAFSRNLAGDLRNSIESICGGCIGRIEVANLHDWAMRFMKRHGNVFHIADNNRRRALMQAAIGEEDDNPRPFSFYREEWERVIQEQNIASRDDYLTARRTGRGTRLARKERTQVWSVFSRYRRLLDEERLVEFADVIRETLFFLKKQPVAVPYRAVLADEAQDFSPNELRLLRALAPGGDNTLFLAGDGHQRIYSRRTTLSSCGIDIRGRSRRLKLNYRTTEQIRRGAVAILEGTEIDDLDGAADSMKGFVSLRRGIAPRYIHNRQLAAEEEAILRILGEWRSRVPDEEICIAARLHDQLNARYGPLLKEAGIPFVEIMPDSQIEKMPPGIRTATFHRLKGLEFRCVLLAGVQADTMPKIPGGAVDEDAAAREDRILQERCLLYVAISRARDEVVVTGYGDPSPFLRGME